VKFQSNLIFSWVSSETNPQIKMHTAIVFVSALAVASAGLIQAPIAYSAYSGYAPIAAAATATQYHAQDEFGQYSYGYAGGPSSKAESKTADGVVRGAYSYVDGNGLVQHAQYIADPVNGFRVAATNLPVGPAPAQVALAAPVAVAPAPVAAVRTIAAAPVLSHHVPAIQHAYIGHPTYAAHAAPLNNGAVHIAPLPLPPADTPEVALARAEHLNAKLVAHLRA